MAFDLRFTKGHGTGNDFVLFSDPEGDLQLTPAQIAAVCDAVKMTLDKTPPELAADIMEHGIVLAGGGALLLGLDAKIAHETGMPIRIAPDPLYSVVLGAGQSLEEWDALKNVLFSSADD